MQLPDKVSLTEVGLRDGLQLETKIVPTDLKISIISALIEAGLKNIQVTSFVNQKKIPQMADAEELINRLPQNKNVIYTALALNLKGVERSYNAGLKNIEISISASDTHSRKNSGMSLPHAMDEAKKMAKLSKKYNMDIKGSVQCAFGCGYEGKIAKSIIFEIVSCFLDEGVDMISLADTTGMASPLEIEKIIPKISDKIKKVPLSLHLHDTYGLGLVNVVFALKCGIVHFDTAIAGMGGCPFIPDAAGNIATEDTAYLLESLNIKTGINIKKVSECSNYLEKFFQKKFPGKIYKTR